MTGSAFVSCISTTRVEMDMVLFLCLHQTVTYPRVCIDCGRVGLDLAEKMSRILKEIGTRKWPALKSFVLAQYWELSYLLLGVHVRERAASAGPRRASTSALSARIFALPRAM